MRSGWAAIVTVPLAAATSAGKPLPEERSVPASGVSDWATVSSSSPQAAARASEQADNAASATVRGVDVRLTVILLSARGLACSPTGHRAPSHEEPRSPRGSCARGPGDLARPRCRGITVAGQRRDAWSRTDGPPTGLRWPTGGSTLLPRVVDHQRPAPGLAWPANGGAPGRATGTADPRRALGSAPLR